MHAGVVVVRGNNSIEYFLSVKDAVRRIRSLTASSAVLSLVISLIVLAYNGQLYP
jgi:hypothetical protein